jgi:predicted GNAT family acetyltransferase
MTDANAITIVDAESEHRFEARVGGALAGYVEYRREPELVVYPHTFVEPEYEGKGIGGALARAALDDARRRGLRVWPSCPFIAGWLDRHPEYQDLDSRRRTSR